MEGGATGKEIGVSPRSKNEEPLEVFKWKSHMIREGLRKRSFKD